MAILDTALDPRAPSFLDNRSATLAALSQLDSAHAQAREGGGEREVTRHHARGKLLPRERIELLVDRDTALLELAATAGSAPAGAGVVTAIGVVESVECMIVGNDPTVRQGGLSSSGRAKADRAVELARRNRLAMIGLWETSEDAFFIDVKPSLNVIFGASERPPLSDHTVVMRGQGAIGEADAVAEDERDALRLLRLAVRRLCPPLPTAALIHKRGVAPRHETDDLLAVTRSDLREIFSRVLDDSELDEVRPHRGASVLGGFGRIHGHPVALLGNCAPELDSESVHKGLELVRQADLAGLPVVVFASQSPGGEPALSRALAAARITVLLDSDPPDWALTSRGFRFTWPGAGRESYDGVIDPRDTRTVLGICMSVQGGHA